MKRKHISVVAAIILGAGIVEAAWCEYVKIGLDAHFDDFPHQRTQQKHVRCLPRRGGQIIGVPAPVLSGFDAGHLRPRLPECVEGGRPCLETRTEFVTGIS